MINKILLGITLASCLLALYSIAETKGQGLEVCGVVIAFIIIGAMEFHKSLILNILGSLSFVALVFFIVS